MAGHAGDFSALHKSRLTGLHKGLDISASLLTAPLDQGPYNFMRVVERSSFSGLRLQEALSLKPEIVVVLVRLIAEARHNSSHHQPHISLEQ